MQPDRRDFLKHVGILTAAGSGALGAAKTAFGSEHGHGSVPADPMGVLVDLTVCVGCRLCEHACKNANGIEPGELASYDDQSIFKTKRRPGPDELTVLNSWPGATSSEGPVYTKVNCVHCNYSACVSACIVGALQKQENGAVTYDAWKCIGCRYCMVACPFQLPAYEYENALTPQVRKCQFCNHRLIEGKLPACVEACPRQALTFGKRNELIALAHEKIANDPKRYIDHVYGEHEIGGTSWMYLNNRKFEQAGFVTVGTAAPPELTEKIQHGVFKYWIAPIGWYSFLSAMMWFTRRREVARHAPAVEGSARSSNVGRLNLAYLIADSLDSDNSCAIATAVADEPETPEDPEPPVHKSHEDHAEPVKRSLNTPGVWALLALVVSGVCFGLYRFIFGLAASTNLDQQHPWGLWIAMDVGSGIALAGGGFVTAALVHIFHREHYHAVARSALLTALLGYTFYVPGLLADIGRWYNIWHPTLPNMWQVNSVLFEVGICVMLYLNVQYLELAPVICQRLLGENWMLRWPRLCRMTRLVHDNLEKIMPAFLVAGVTLSTFHQSSLGNLMVIAPYKLHPLWWTPISPLLFLWSAMMVGFPMVIFTILFASWALKRKPEMHILGPLSLYVPFFLLVYLLLKIGDVIWRGKIPLVLEMSPQGISWIAEMLIGVVIPLILIPFSKVRRSPAPLGAAVLMVIAGVVLNRLNCFVIGYHPPYATKAYFPSVTEFAVSLGLVAALMLTYRVAVTYLPILEPRGKVGGMKTLLTCLLIASLAGFIWAADIGVTTQESPLGPDVVQLKELSTLYRPVPFNHKTHARMSEMWDGCTTCHHRNPTTQPVDGIEINPKDQEDAANMPACHSCHQTNPESADIRMPTLKGAYHRQCLNCHREWANENSCTVCHEPVADAIGKPQATADDIIGRMHPPIPEPDLKLYQARFTPAAGGNVIFRHKEHSTEYGLRCVNCHRHDNCASCHSANPASTGPRPLTPGRTWAQSHGPCIGCHQQDRCKTCHYDGESDQPPPFEHRMTGQLLDKDHANLKCGQCHTLLKVRGLITCGDAACHKSQPAMAFPDKRPGPIVQLASPTTAPSTRPVVETSTDSAGVTVRRVRRGT